MSRLGLSETEPDSTTAFSNSDPHALKLEQDGLLILTTNLSITVRTLHEWNQITKSKEMALLIQWSKHNDVTHDRLCVTTHEVGLTVSK